jgi:4-amino-4-deoxy-L-arabinose transferase-like glycosyltransferase
LQRDLFFRDETRYGAVVKDMIRNDAWFTLTIGDAFYSEKPPLFFSLVRLATEIAGTTAPSVFFAVVTATAFLFLAASDALLRTAGFDRRTVLSANLLLLSVPWIAIHMQLLRMDLLFSAFILVSLACYVRGVDVGKANFRPLLGGLLAGLAVLTKGPFGALIPLLSLAAYVAATRRLRLLVRADVLASLAMLLLPVLLWIADLHATFGDRAFEMIFGEQILERAVSGRDAHRSIWEYLAWLALTLMPWLLLLPALLVERIRKAVLAGFADGVRPPGLRLILPMLAASLLLLGLVAQKNIHYLLPLAPALMVLPAIAYARLDAAAPRLIDWFYVGLALAALAAPPAGLWALGLAPAKVQASAANYIRPETLAHLAATLSLTAIPLAVAARLRGEARLFAGVAAVAIMLVGVKTIALADLDRAYSPRHMAAAFEAHVPEDQPILVHDIYWGSLSYHFRHPLIYTDEPGASPARSQGPGAPAYAIVMNSSWERRPDLWAGFDKIDEIRLEGRKVALLRRSGEERPQ